MTDNTNHDMNTEIHQPVDPNVTTSHEPVTAPSGASVFDAPAVPAPQKPSGPRIKTWQLATAGLAALFAVGGLIGMLVSGSDDAPNNEPTGQAAVDADTTEATTTTVADTAVAPAPSDAPNVDAPIDESPDEEPPAEETPDPDVPSDNNDPDPGVNLDILPDFELIPLPTIDTNLLLWATIPDVVGEPFDDAEATLLGMGFTVERVDQLVSRGINGTVISSDPEAGSVVLNGTTITLTVVLRIPEI